MGRDINVTVDGQTSTLHTRALTVSQALHSMGINLDKNDVVEPPAGTWLSRTNSINMVRSRTLVIWEDPAGTFVTLDTAAATARAALTQAGIMPSPDDTIKLNGSLIHLDDPLPLGKNAVLQYTPAQTITLTSGGQKQLIQSSAATVSRALWNKGVSLTGADFLTSPLTQILEQSIDLNLLKAVPITITVDGKEIHTLTTAATVGEALAQNTISLQDLDYSKPSEESPIPEDGKIQVVRVKIVVLDQEEIIPYTVEYTNDKSLPVGEKIVTQTGKNGIADTRVLIRYEDGVEVSRQTQTRVVLVNAVNEKITKNSQTAQTTTPTQSSTSTVSAGTINTENGPMPYYLAVSVYVTSYSPCRSGGSGCSNLTASGAPVTKGVLAVTVDWYQIFKGYKIYVPGYGTGTVEDTGGGIPGEYWIDLGYSDSDWVNWSKWVTVYFLSPEPPNFSGTLP